MHESQLAGTRGGRHLHSVGRAFLSISRGEPHLARQAYILTFTVPYDIRLRYESRHLRLEAHGLRIYKLLRIYGNAGGIMSLSDPYTASFCLRSSSLAASLRRSFVLP